MNLLKVIFKTVLVIALLLLLVGYLNRFAPLFDSISHFRLHLLAVVGLVGLVLLLINRDFRYLFLSLLVAGIYTYYNYFPKVIKAPGLHIKHIQFNMSFQNRELESFKSFLKSSSIDIVTLQEVTQSHWQSLQELRNLYPYQKLCKFYPTAGGVAILSKYRIEDSNCIDGSGLIVAKINIEGVMVSVASIHLFWPYPFGQHQQISTLKSQLESIKAPAIIAGDFNAAPWSFALERVAKYSNTNIAKGVRWSIEIKHHIPYLPSLKLPIDQLLLSEGLIAFKIETKEHFGSDHYAILSDIVIGLACFEGVKLGIKKD